MAAEAAEAREELAWASYTALSALAYISREDLVRELVVIAGHTITGTCDDADAPIISESLVTEFLQLQGVGIPEGFDEFVELHNRLIDWAIASSGKTGGASLRLSPGRRSNSPLGRSISHAASHHAMDGSPKSFRARDVTLINPTEDAPVMTAEEANTANLSAMNLRSSNRSEHASPDGLRTSARFDMASSTERASARQLSDQKFGSGSGSVDNGPELSFQLRRPPPLGEGGQSSSMRSSMRSSESEREDGEASDGGGSPPLSPSKQKTKTKRFRERRLSKDLQDVLGAADFDSGQVASVPAAGLAAQPTSLLLAAGSEDAVVGGEGEASFKSIDSEGESFRVNGVPLSPVKKTTRLDIGKSGLPVDKGGHQGRRSVEIGTEIEELVDDAVTPFDRSLVGTYSCHGAEPTDTGSIAKINQDCASISHPFARTPGTALFCVYDGHGKFGHHVSQEVLHSLLYELEENNERLQEDPAALLAETFENVNVHLRLCAKEQPCIVDAMDSGACAIVVWMRGRELVVAGAGDCRAVLGTRHDAQLCSTPLSDDHKVNLPAEQARIEAAGGWVRPESGDADDFNPARLYEAEGKPWLGPGLCVARCLGDLKANACGLIPTPEICMHTLQSTDLFLILASDGVWEFIDNDEAVAIVGQFYDKGLPALDACRFLIAKAALCWRKFEGDYRDDITAIVVYLGDVVTALELERERYAEYSLRRSQQPKKSVLGLAG